MYSVTNYLSNWYLGMLQFYSINLITFIQLILNYFPSGRTYYFKNIFLVYICDMKYFRSTFNTRNNVLKYKYKESRFLYISFNVEIYISYLFYELLINKIIITNILHNRH